jgi:hypothetical protein
MLYVFTRIYLLIFVAAEIGASETLLSKMTSASAAISAFRQCLPSRCLAIGYSVTIHFVSASLDDGSLGTRAITYNKK